MPHDFREQLAFSEEVRHEAFWDEIYRKAFPDLLSSSLVNRRDNGAQRAGIDRTLVLQSQKVLRIDEKTRKKNYDDILLEFISNDRTGAPGWMDKDLMIDYLAYAILPARRCYLLPWDMLRRVWLTFRDDWIARGRRKAGGFCIVKAENAGYVTHSVAVAPPVLLSFTSRASIIQLDGPSESLRPLAFTRPTEEAQQRFDFAK